MRRFVDATILSHPYSGVLTVLKTFLKSPEIEILSHPKLYTSVYGLLCAMASSCPALLPFFVKSEAHDRSLHELLGEQVFLFVLLKHCWLSACTLLQAELATLYLEMQDGTEVDETSEIRGNTVTGAEEAALMVLLKQTFAEVDNAITCSPPFTPLHMKETLKELLASSRKDEGRTNGKGKKGEKAPAHPDYASILEKYYQFRLEDLRVGKEDILLRKGPRHHYAGKTEVR